MSWRTWLIAASLLVPTLSGCIGTGPGGDVSPTASGAAGPPVELSEPVELTGDEGGFEPSIEVGPDGTVYATAAPTQRPASGDQLSSWLWYAPDQGADWREVPSPAQAHEAFPGFEGDVAVDGEGRLYFVDINLADTFFHRWAPGPTWELSRPLATSIPVDDRPWLAAHGDGVVYLLLNNGASLPGPGNLVEGDAGQGSKWLFVSEDAGRTWTPGRQVDDGWCQLAASPADDDTLLMACQRGAGRGNRAYVKLSRDRGATFEQVHEMPLEQGAGYLVPGAAVDATGNLYGAFVDEHVEFSGLQDIAWEGDEPGRVRYAASADGGETWTEHDVTPFEARFSTMHASGGASGTLALTFYATEDRTPDESSQWYPYLMVSANADTEDPDWTTVRLLDEPAGEGPVPPRDFFQNDVGPGNTVHVILQQNRPFEPTRDGVAAGIPAGILYVRQLSGPNLEAPLSGERAPTGGSTDGTPELSAPVPEGPGEIPAPGARNP